jgi:hypothetical protein
MRSIPGWKLDHFDLTVEIQCEKVAGMGDTIVLPDNGVNLVGSWPSIVQVIQSRPNPPDQKLTENNQQNGKCHANANAKQKQVLSPWHL